LIDFFRRQSITRHQRQDKASARRHGLEVDETIDQTNSKLFNFTSFN